jgi:hypothetical protein
MLAAVLFTIISIVLLVLLSDIAALFYMLTLHSRRNGWPVFCKQNLRAICV